MFSWISFFSQDMLYQSLKFTNGIWVLAELKMQPGNPVVQVSEPALVISLFGFRNRTNYSLERLLSSIQLAVKKPFLRDHFILSHPD